MDLHARNELEADGCSVDLDGGPITVPDGEDVPMEAWQVQWSMKQQSAIADWDVAWRSAEPKVLRTPGTMLDSACIQVFHGTCTSYLLRRPKARIRIPIDS